MRFWNLTKDTEIPEDGVLDIEGPIAEEAFWGDETSSKEFRKALESVGNVTVHINSPGGDVMAGAEIYSALREHSLNGKGKVTVIVTALAASAASVVAMAGDEILISPVAYMMIHNPWTITMGDSKELRHTAKVLDEIRDGLVTAYERRTGMDRDELKKMLENETWMSAEKCVELGFADSIYGGEIRAAAMVSASTMTKATPEEVRRMCERWEKVHQDAKGKIKAAEILDAVWAADVPDRDTRQPEAPADNEKRAEIARRAEIAQRATIAAMLQ